MEATMPSWLKTASPCEAMPADFYPARTVDDPPAYIYMLRDPETREIRYFGKTIRPAERLRGHMNEKPARSHKSHWIQSLKRRGLVPEFEIIETVIGGWPWEECERYWIALARRLGVKIVNTMPGGEGVTLTPGSKAKMAATWKGRKHTPETISRLKASRALHPPRSAESKSKVRAAMIGRKILWVGKVAEALRKFTPGQEASVRDRLRSGEKGIDLAREFGVHRTTISKIKKGSYRGQGS